MSFITTFDFNENGIDEIKEASFGKNWPVNYIIEDGKEAYIGQTTNLLNRSRTHIKNKDRARLKKIHVVFDEDFNLSAAFDIESWLIQYLSADNQLKLQNGNAGLKNHNYYEKIRYEAKFELIWEELLSKEKAKHSLNDLKNTDFFKYSPYKALSEDQLNTVYSICKDLGRNQLGVQVVNGQPGTGKTVVATFLLKFLKDQSETKHLKVGLVVPMTSLRKTLKKVFRNIKGLDSGMVIGPSDVIKEKYDVLVVDEAHRLKKRKNITNYKSFDDVNKFLGLSNDGTELDWILKSAKYQILFYDKNQSVKPSDVSPLDFEILKAQSFTLTQQLRVLGGEAYITFVNRVFAKSSTWKYEDENYEVLIFDDLRRMKELVSSKHKKYGLSLMLAGYAWEWKSKNKPEEVDIDLEGLKLRWNSQNTDWVNSKNAANEVGCIHTVQGYDLNYAGVIIGPELGYDLEKKEFIFYREHYKDRNGHQGVRDEEEIKRYILNIYKTLLTRAIKGTYIYAVDPDLNEYLKSCFVTA